MNRHSATMTTPGRHLRMTKLLFFSIVGFVGLAVVAALLIVQYNRLSWDLKEYSAILVWVMALLSLILLIISKRFFNKGVAAAKISLKPLVDKLNQYRSALLVHLAICEAAAMMNIVVFIFTANSAFLVFAAVLLGCMMAVMPLKRRLVAELELDSQESELV
jgi:hypothetical protein